jgi:hypothetical protein
MTAASFTHLMIRRIGRAAAAAAAVTLITASAGTANATRLPAPAPATAPGGHAASVCSPAQVAAATCLNYTIAAGADPWVAAVTSELAQPGGEAIAAKFVAARGKTHHDAEQARLAALLHNGGGVHPDAKRLPAYTYSGVGTAAPGGSHWEYQSYALMGICIVNSCPVTDKVTFTYTIATSSHWVLEARYQVAHGTYYVVSKWNCDLRLDEGKTSRHLASWSICGKKSGLGSSGVIEETSRITTGGQRDNLFGAFTFLVGPSGGVPAKFSFQSKRWYVEENGGLFY